MIFNRPVWIRSHCLFSVQMWCPMHYRCRAHCQRETLKTAARDAQAWRRGQPNLNWVWLFTLHGWNCKSLWLHLKEMRLVSFTSSSSIHISISLRFNTYLKQNFVMEHLKYFFLPSEPLTGTVLSYLKDGVCLLDLWFTFQTLCQSRAVLLRFGTTWQLHMLFQHPFP